MRKLDDAMLVSGQIRPGQVAELKQSGVTMIVNNRPDGEEPGQPTGAEIEDAAEASGVGYRFIPIQRGIGPADVEAMQEAMDAAEGTVLAFCRTGTRSTYAWALARRNSGAEIEEIRQAAAGAGYDLTPIAHLL